MIPNELEIQLLHAIDELHARFEHQHHQWLQRYHALQQQLAESQHYKVTLQEQNAALQRQLHTLHVTPENGFLVKQFKILGAHLEVLAKEAAVFSEQLNQQQVCHHSNNRCLP